MVDGSPSCGSRVIYPGGFSSTHLQGAGVTTALRRAMTICGSPTRLKRVRRARLVILKARCEGLKYEPETLQRARKRGRIQADEDLWGNISIAEIAAFYRSDVI